MKTVRRNLRSPGLLCPLAAASAGALGLIVLSEWLLDPLDVAEARPRFTPMAPTTAVCLVLLGAALIVRRLTFAPRALRVASVILHGLVLTLCGTFFAYYVIEAAAGRSWGLEWWVRRVPVAGQPFQAGRMSPLTAILLALLSLGVLGSFQPASTIRRRYLAAQGAAAAATVLACILLVGYWYSAPLLYGGWVVPVALSTAVGIFLLGAALLLDGPDAWLRRWAGSPSIAARFTRVAVPGVAAVVLMVGWLDAAVLSSVDASWRPMTASAAALVTAGLVVLVLFVAAGRVHAVVRLAERALRESEERFRQMADNIDVVFWIASPDWQQVLYVSPAYEKTWGRSCQSLYDQPLSWIEAIPEDDRHALQEELARRQAEDWRIAKFPECPIQRPDGSLRWILARAYPIRDEKGDVVRIVGIAEDVTERREAEQSLRRERARAHEYLDIAGVILLALDSSGNVVLMNRKGCEVLGYAEEEVLGRNWCGQFLPPRVREEMTSLVQRILAGDMEAVEAHENPVLCKDGRERLISWHNTFVWDSSGGIVGILSSGEDITEQRATQAQLLQSQKMEAVGQLAGGIAHDFRNQLTVIKGYGELLLRRGLVPEGGQTYIREILQAVERSTALTGMLLTFSRRGTEHLHVVPTDLNDVIQGMAKSLRPVIGENVRLDVLPARDVAVVRVDVALFQQAVLNLVLNARDAMPRGGRLSIGTDRVEPEPQFVARCGGTALGPHARVTVRDTGAGMDEEALRRLFEPFFTTKPAGRGTGLGLAMTHGFVKQSGGFLHVVSHKAQGTTVEIYLPCVAEEVAPRREPHADATPGGRETILIVEDEHAVRHLLAETLREAGYSVLEAAGAADALPLAEHFAGQIHLLISDVVLCGMEGPELAGRVREIRPDLRALFLSGYAGGVRLRPGAAGGDAPLIPKPLNFPELLTTVRRVLDHSVRAESPFGAK